MKPAAALLAVLLAGCSTMSSERFAVGTPTRTQGVPFTLNKPQMTVVRTPGKNGAPDSYAITTTYVRDSEQQYVLQISPNWFSDVDWTMTLDGQGTLTDTNAKLTNQAPAILKSLASLAAAALDQSKIDEPAAVDEIHNELVADLQPGGPHRVWRTMGDPDQLGVKIDDATAAALQAVERRMHDRMQKLATYGQVDRTFAYMSVDERTLLITALRLSARKLDPTWKHSCVGGCTDLQTAYLNRNAPASDRAKEIIDLWDRADQAKLKAVAKTESAARSNLYAAYRTLPPNEYSDLTASLKLTGMLNEALQSFKGTNGTVSLLFDVLDRSSTSWQKTALADLDEKIAIRRADLRLGDSGDEANDATLSSLLIERATLLGVRPEFERRQRIQALLTTERGPGKYKILSDEITFLDGKISAAETAVNGTSTDPVPDPAAPAAFMVADAKFSNATVDASNTWIVGKLRGDWDRPAYVVVVEPPVPIAPPPAAHAPPQTNTQAGPQPGPAAGNGQGSSDTPTHVDVPQPKVQTPKGHK